MKRCAFTLTFDMHRHRLGNCVSKRQSIPQRAILQYLVQTQVATKLGTSNALQDYHLGAFLVTPRAASRSITERSLKTVFSLTSMSPSRSSR
jgi:hypothetical protein